MFAKRSWVRVATLTVLAAMPFSAGSAKATDVQIEGWDTVSDAAFHNWVTNLQAYTPSYSTTTGVTNGAAAIAMTGTASPSYGQMLRSPSLVSNTSLFSTAQSISFDVTTQAGAFGFFLQWDVDLNNSALGFTSLDAFNYQGVSIGGTTTLTVPITAAQRATLAGSGTGTELVFQVGGGSSGNPQTFYVDNIRATLAPVPEPTSIAALGVVGAGLLSRRRRG